MGLICFGAGSSDEDIEIEKKFLSSELVKVGTTVGVKVCLYIVLRAVHEQR